MEIRVRRGDSFWYYSQLFHIPIVLITDSNPAVNPRALTIGESVQIPGFTVITRTVQEGDSFWKLAQPYNLNVDVLLLLNQSINPNDLQVGQQIRIPVRVTNVLVRTDVPYDFQRMVTDMDNLLAIYPFMRRRVIGRSVLGLPLYELIVGNGPRKVHVNASFHANEWITTSVLMKFINEYLLALTNNTPFQGFSPLSLYSQSQLSAVPMVNPDGVNLVLNGPPPGQEEELIRLNNGSEDFSGWKANIRGVDLNNQFPANWEIEQERKPQAPAGRDFPGYAPLTEPEAIAMAELAKEENFDRLLALHTQGKEIYWGYEGLEPPESEILANQFERASGYEAIQYIDSHAGYKDWFIQEFRKPGFTVELGIGQNPLPLSQFDEIYTDTSALLIRSLL